jgi:hypothetical protein
MARYLALALLLIFTAPVSAHEGHGHHCHLDQDDAQRCH